MGRGDRKTRRGKITKGSYGKSRPKTQRDTKASRKKKTEAKKTKK
ncbi:MAG: 30S ribosomal protein THX [Planctomycetes bacterium]|nr:30S ribosomal protein THX [Planctomycetota bacterium]